MNDALVTTRRSRIRAFDMPDQYLFFVLFVLGAVAIWTLKLLHVPQIAVTAVPVGLMMLYAAIALWTKRYRIREDKVGDNIYYLGFLYTLVSLSYALYVYNPDIPDATDIITNFGIAIFSTIIGLAGRVFFNQMREDPIEYEREARVSLAQATNELRAHLADICIEMSNFKRKTLQIMEEGVTDIANSTRATLSESVERFAATSNEVIEKIRAAFASFIDHSARLNEIASKNVEALQALFERIERIEASPDLLSGKLDPVIQQFAEIANEAMRRNRAQTNDLKRMREAIDATLAATDALKGSVDASMTGIGTRIERFGKGLDESAAIARKFHDAMGAAASQVKADVEAVRQVVATLDSGADARKKAVAEIRTAIEADMGIARQHRDATAKMLEESRAAVTEVEQSLVTLSRTIVEQLGGR
jgi:methyl-accepting chemotaxis protein